MNANISEQEIATAVPIAAALNRKWSDRTIAAVIEAYNAGLTFTQIGQQFDINKNQAAGILNRAGALKKRILGRARTGIKPQNKNTNNVNPRKKFRKVPFDARISAAPFLRVSLMERKFNQCAMPDPKCDDPSEMTYCGQPTFGTLPYCGWCARIIYQPARAVHREPRPR